jgi:polar amino acid transport system substrate-binding protein
MYYETETKMRGRRDAITSLLTPADLQTTERSPDNMERAVENFCRMSAKKAGMKGKSQVRRPAEEIMRKLFGVALMLGIGIAVVPTDATARPPIACGTIYTVARGDTLFKIAERAFGNGWLYKQIFEANSDVLPNSASVEIGNELLIPCLDGTGQVVREDAVAQEPLAEPGKPEATPVAATMEPAQTTPGLLREARKLIAMVPLPMQSIAGPVYPTASPASITKDELGATELTTSEPPLVIPRIRLLTGSGFAPFADENLPQGGMITDLVSRALKAVAPGRQSRVAFVNDWAAHLNFLLPGGAFDVSFPWFKPDCSKSERLNAEMQRRCAEFEFSNPIFEVRVGFYTRLGDALVEIRSLAALSGKRLCRPNGRFAFDLEQNDLVEANVLVEAQYTAQQCFVRLVEGQVDVVTLVKSAEMDEQLRQLGIVDSVTEIDGLESAQTLHALVAKQSPNGQAHLDLINQGLAELMASGGWFEVVAFHQGRKLALMN